MAARKRTKLERDQQVVEIVKLAIRGMPQSKIAEKFGLTQQQVSHDIKEVRSRLLPIQAGEMTQARAERMAELVMVKQEYWEQWDRSKLDKEVQTQEKITNARGANDNGGEGNGNSERIKAALRTEGQCGDTRFLDGVRKVITEECRIAGLYAPKKLEHSGGDKAIEIKLIEIVRPKAKPDPVADEESPATAATSTPAAPPVPPEILQSGEMMIEIVRPSEKTT